MKKDAHAGGMMKCIQNGINFPEGMHWACIFIE